MSSTDFLPSIHEILTSDSLCTHFQPIDSARQKAIAGLEARARSTAAVEVASRGMTLRDGRLMPPETLFRVARQHGVVARLEQLCHETAIRSFTGLQNRPDGLVLFMNFEASISDP